MEEQLNESNDKTNADSSRKHILWSGLDYVAMPVGMLIATPILIKHLGIEQYGLFILANTLVGFSSIFNFGFGDTALRYVSHYVQLRQKAFALEIVRTLILLTLAAGFLISTFFVLAAPTATEIFNISSIPNAVESLYVTALIMTLRLLESVYIAVLRGCYRYDLSGLATSVTKIGNIAALLLLTSEGYALPALLSATACASLVNILLLFAFCARTLGTAWPAFSYRAFNEIKKYSSWSWLQGLSGMVYANIDRLMIPALLGPAALGVYGVCIQLAQNIHYGLAAISNFIFPKFSMLGAQRFEKESDAGAALRDLYMTATKSLTVPAVLAGSVIAIFSYQILDLWVGQTIAEQGRWLLALLALAYGWFTANSVVTYYTLNGLGHARLQAGVSVTGAVVMALSTLIFIPLFGLVGAAIARLPDTLFRLCVRMYVGKAVIGNVRKVVALDFLWLTGISISGAYLTRELAIWWLGKDHLLRHPAAVGMVVLSVCAMYYMLNLIEGRIMGTRLLQPEG